MIQLKVRAIVGIMIFFGYFLIYVVRYNLSVHIVDMVKSPNELLYEQINYSQTMREINQARAGNVLDIISWSENKVSLILAAYHIGYGVCFPIFHNLGDRFGPMWVAGASGLTSGVLNCLTPASAYYNFWLLFVLRILTGFCAGAMQPSMVQVLRHWVPPTERHHFMWAYCGLTLGTCSTFLICAAVQYYSRWSVGFYTIGVVQIIWAIIWILVVTDSPRKHAFIRKEELSYLTTAIGTVFAIKLTNSQVPWRLIVTSVPFWALCSLSFGYAWMIIAVCLHGPLYYAIVLEYSIYEASALTALPFLIRLILGTIFIQAYQWYKNNGRLKRIKHIRKYLVFCSHVIPGVLVLMTWFLPVQPGPELLTTAIALTAAGMDLTLDICYEISPTYVNSINTVIKIISNSPGIIIPVCVAGVVRKFKNTISVWRHIWCFHAFVLMLSGVVFILWGDTHVQSWNYIRRPHRRILPTIRPSTMSNITEKEEDDSIRTSSLPQSQINAKKLLST